MTAPSLSESYDLPPALDFIRNMLAFNHALAKVSAQMERELGVSTQQRVLLRCLATFPGISPGALARLLHLDPGTITATVVRLERKLLVTRITDATDRRRVSLWLTPQGNQLLNATARTAEDALAEWLSKQPKQQLRAMQAVVTSATTALLASLQ